MEQEFKSGDPRMDKYSLKDYYLWKLQGDLVYVLEEGGRVAGVVDVVVKEDYLLVDMLARNSLVNAEKVGSRLLEFVEGLAEKYGKSRVVLEALDRAVEFYSRKGYKKVSTKADEEWGNLTVMEKLVKPVAQLALASQ